MAAEAEAVGHDAIDPGLAGDVGDVVEVAALVGVVEVDRRRQDAACAIARAEATSSTPPEAPSRWPSWLLVLETWSRLACGPKTVFIALVSARSPRPVLVPWALM